MIERIAWQCKKCKKCKKCWSPTHPTAVFVQWFNQCIDCTPGDSHLLDKEYEYAVNRESAIRKECHGNTGLPPNVKVDGPSDTHSEYRSKVAKAWGGVVSLDEPEIHRRLFKKAVS